MDTENRNVSSIEGLINGMMGKIQGELRNMKKLNIVVAGKTGAGKSQLINAVFREDVADTGQGFPVTQYIRKITKSDVPLVIYDTPGLVLDAGQQAGVKNEINEVIQDCFRKGADHFIHVIWYCIGVPTDGIDETEITWLKELTDSIKKANVPVILVLTKSVNKTKTQEIKEKIDDMNLAIRNIVPVLALNHQFDDDTVVKSHGLRRLVGITADVIPDTVQRSLMNAQKIDIAAKVTAAKKWANGFMAASVGVGFVPIPFADAAILIPMQVGMLAGITATFGFKFEKAYLSAIISSLFGTAGVAFTGRTIVANLLKFIPGVGTVAGGAISSATAALLTASLGRAYIKVLEMIAKKGFTSEIKADKKTLDELQKILKTELNTGSKVI